LRPRETRTESFVFALPKDKKAAITAWVEYFFQAEALMPTEMRVRMAEATRKLR